MSQVELARRTGIPPQHIRALEEKNWMGRERLYRVADVLGVHPKELENSFKKSSDTP